MTTPRLPDQLRNSPTAKIVAAEMDTHGALGPNPSGVVTRNEATIWLEQNLGSDPRAKQLLSEALGIEPEAVTKASIEELFGGLKKQTHAAEEVIGALRSVDYNGNARSVIEGMPR